MMSEDDLLKQALEDELEDSYQEYLTYALKGETAGSDADELRIPS